MILTEEGPNPDQRHAGFEGAGVPLVSGPAPSADTAFRSPRPALWLRALADILSVQIAFLFALRLYTFLIDSGLLQRSAPTPAIYVALGLIFSLGVVSFGLVLGAYRPGSSVLQFVETRAAVRAVWLSGATLFALLFVFKLGAEFSRIQLLTALLSSTISIAVVRRLLLPLIGRIQHAGTRGQRVVIVGTGAFSQLLMKKIVQAPAAGLTLIGFLDDVAPLGHRLSCRLRQGRPERFEAPVLGRTWSLSEVHRSHRVSLLLLNLSEVSRETADDVVRTADDLGIKVGLVPNLGDVRADLLELYDLTAVPVLTRLSILRKRPAEATKRGLDLLLTIPLLLVTSPLWVFIALAIRLDSPGPVLFRQVRIGRNGRAYVMLKFRTMSVDTDRYAFSPASDSDPRVTRVGRVLRALGLDELPQLLNVLKGDMSLVGPRPEMPFLVERYSDLERSRLEAKPGITGLWQLSPDRADQIHENLEYDIYYVRNRSILLDLLILLETIIFTVSVPVTRAALALRTRLEERRADRKSDLPRDMIKHPRAASVLLVLDQRVRGGEGRLWFPCLAATRSASLGLSVRVLVAPGNLPTMTRTIRDLSSPAEIGFPDGHPSRSREGPETRSDTDSGPPMVEEVSPFDLVPFRAYGELSRWTTSAQLVVTDLEHVRDRVLENSQKPVVFVSPTGQVHATGVIDDTLSPVIDSLLEALAATGPDQVLAPGGTVVH